MKPLADNVVIQQEEAETKTSSGLYLPDSAAEKPKMGKVLAIGKDIKEIKVGDKVVYKPYGVTEVSVDGKDVLLVKEEDVLMILKEKK